MARKKKATKRRAPKTKAPTLSKQLAAHSIALVFAVSGALCIGIGLTLKYL